MFDAHPLSITSLLGHAQVEMALACLGSLRRYSREPLHLRLHDDGTLTPADLERMASALGEPAVVRREGVNERMHEMLRSYPAARRYREQHPLALKLLDAALLSGEPVLRYCDADVLFRRPFEGLFALPPSAGVSFMADSQNAYSLRSWHLLRHPRLRPPQRINTGIFTFDLAHFDLDFLEWYLARPEMRFAPVWVEQTAWALLAGRAGACWIDPAQAQIPRADGAFEGDPVALHFVSPVRGQLKLALATASDRGREEAAEIRFQAAPRCYPWHLAVTEARRRRRS